MTERADILEMLAALQLAGMRAAAACPRAREGATRGTRS